MFTFVEMQMNHGGTWDSTNNVIEEKSIHNLERCCMLTEDCPRCEE